MPARRNAERRTSTNKQPSTASSSSPLSLQKQKTPPSHTSTSLGGARFRHKGGLDHLKGRSFRLKGRLLRLGGGTLRPKSETARRTSLPRTSRVGLLKFRTATVVEFFAYHDTATT